jgi:hypothetical protein
MTKEEIQKVIDKGGYLLRQYAGMEYMYKPTRILKSSPTDDNTDLSGYFYRYGKRDNYVTRVTTTSYWREATPEEIAKYVKQ